ncbi:MULTISPECIES: lipopolysaccharide biosynthesis protein [unclassified Pseudarthrobacter]|uniref:lipopolysaccharide biosynthesis protein n=1 Tax=unclassified Pseudarthrobacter TaxID=2647000 RepID=UPI003076E589
MGIPQPRWPFRPQPALEEAQLVSFRKFTRLFQHNSPSLLVVGQILVSAMGLLTAPIIAQSLGPSGRGETAAVITAFNLVPILLAIGIPTVVRRDSALSSVSASLRTARILCLVAFLPALGMAFLLHHTAFATVVGNASVPVIIGLTLTPLTISWLCDIGVLMARERYRAVFLIKVLFPFLNLSLLVALWVASSATTATVLWAAIIAKVVTSLASFVIVRVPLQGEYTPVGPLLRSSWRFAGSSIGEAATNRLDQILLLPLLGAYQTGIYAVGVTIGTLPLALAQGMGGAFYGPVARSEGRKRQRYKGMGIRSGILSAVLSGAALAVASPLIVPLVFGQEFIAALPVIFVCLVGSVFMCAAFVASSMLAAEGKGWHLTIGQFASLGVSVGLLYWWGPALMAPGAAWSSTVGYLVLAVVVCVSLQIPLKGFTPRKSDFANTFNALFRRIK